MDSRQEVLKIFFHIETMDAAVSFLENALKIMTDEQAAEMLAKIKKQHPIQLDE